MSQFQFWNDVSSVVSLEGPITKGPQPRYERKQASSSVSLNSSKLQKSLSTSCLTQKTPSKKTPLRKTRTPTPNKGRTPTGDRFIPSRVASNLDLAKFKLECDEPTTQRVFSYLHKAPTAPDGYQNPMRVLYTQTHTPVSVKSTSRYIPQAPDRILDAPDIIDDFYLNLIDWGSNNVLAAALGTQVYLWNAATGKIEHLLGLEGNDYVCSVQWIQEGDSLAVGTTQGTVELWDCAQMKRLRVMRGHSARVGALAWNCHVLTSGCRSGQIIHHDVRVRDHQLTTIAAHSSEVCGLTWSSNGRLLASGGNDNVVNIYTTAQGHSGGTITYHSQSHPLYTFNQHQAAVKALAWCPWQPHLLATGGGTADRHIRLWNCNTGSCLNAIDTKSQVCSLLWAPNYKELVSGHGFANNEVMLWKPPSMTKVAELRGHTARVLHLALSPDGTTILSAGADETLRLWLCFQKDLVKEGKRAGQEGGLKTKPSALKQCIR